MTLSKVHFAQLDGLRTAAFLGVFLFHCYYSAPPPLADNLAYRVLHFLTGNGDLGVNFFFVLSGFLITYLLLAEERARGRIWIGAFYLRRILRIWPLYYLTFGFGYFAFPALVELAGGHIEESANPWLYLLFLGNFNSIANGDPASATLSVLWSIAVEEQFYLVWPLLLVAFRKRRPALFGLVILGSLAFRAAYADQPLVLFYHTGSVFSDLAIGGLLGWYSFTRGWKVNGHAGLGRWQIVVLYALGLSLILLREYFFATPPLRVLERLVYASFFAFVLFEQTFAAHSFYKAGRFTLLDKAGKYTYGLYCLHVPAMVFSVGVALLLGKHETEWWVLGLTPLITLGLSITLSLLSYHGFEKRFLQLALGEHGCWLRDGPKRPFRRSTPWPDSCRAAAHESRFAK
jgi:peptidoglycan/LPS O-acetylase OafA/YrhL